MKITVRLTEGPVEIVAAGVDPDPGAGAVVEFRGVVRGEEAGRPIGGLVYEAYAGMAEKELRRVVEAAAARHPVRSVEVIHRLGPVPVGAAAIWLRVVAAHRGEAFGFLAETMDRLKREVPIWKVAVMPVTGEPTAGGQAPEGDWAVERVWELIDEVAGVLPGQRRMLEESVGLVCAETVRTPWDYPPFPQSAMDGYALKEPGGEAGYAVVGGVVVAGDAGGGRLESGQAVRVLTGAMVPEGTDWVVRQEDVWVEHGVLKLKPGVMGRPGGNVRGRGGIFRQGEVLLERGAVVSAGTVGYLASAGVKTVAVVPVPRVEHVVTGSELVVVGGELKPGQIYDSNGPMMRALLAECGVRVEPRWMKDDFEGLLAEVREFAGDLLLISGGSGPGERDHTRRALEEGGFVVRVARVHSRPGRPLIVATRGRQVALGLPGNPLSHFVCHHVFVRRVVARMGGHAPPDLVVARWRGEAPRTDEDRRPVWTPGVATMGREGLEFAPLGWRHSGDLSPLARANALAWGGPDGAGMVRVLPTGLPAVV